MAALRPLDPDTLQAVLRGSDADLPAAVRLKNVLTPDECSSVTAMLSTRPTDQARVEGRGHARSERREESAVRSTRRTHITHDPKSDWLYRRLGQHIADLNQRHWQFRISYIEPMQLLEYSENDHYDWHTDLGSTGVMALRKLSLTIQLSPSTDYEGGQLELRTGSSTIIAPSETGSGLIFPSWQPHRVRPVSSGIRRALVAWVVGKRSLR